MSKPIVAPKTVASSVGMTCERDYTGGADEGRGREDRLHPKNVAPSAGLGRGNKRAGLGTHPGKAASMGELSGSIAVAGPDKIVYARTAEHFWLGSS